jgi:hypothetical protein
MLSKNRPVQIGLRLKPDELNSLDALRRAGNHPSISAAIRAAMPEVFHEIAKEGRPQGFSPKRKTG